MSPHLDPPPVGALLAWAIQPLRMCAQSIARAMGLPRGTVSARKTKWMRAQRDGG